MKFEGEDAGDRLIGVSVCSEEQDVLLATRQGRAMRFPVSTVRVFASRNSTGVRGIALAEGDEVISMSLVDGGKGIPTEDRDAYLRQSRALRQAENAVEAGEAVTEEEIPAGEEAAAPADHAFAGALRRTAGQGGVRAHRGRRRASASAPRPSSIG
jgi:DNA gyrase subunit A